MTDSFLSRLILPCFISSSFSTRMRSSSTDAGSSLGSCGTSLPRMARSRILDFDSLIRCFSSSLLTLIFFTNARIFSTVKTIFICSFNGGKTHKYVCAAEIVIVSTVVPFELFAICCCKNCDSNIIFANFESMILFIF